MSSLSKSSNKEFEDAFDLKIKWISKLFPFFIALDKNLNFVALGPLVSRVIPEIKLQQKLEDHFKVVTPSLELTQKPLSEHTEDLVAIVWNKKSSFCLHGQIFVQGDFILFLCVPRIVDIIVLKDLNLTAQDFPFFDSTVNLLFLLQTQRNSIKENRSLIESLQKSENELKNYKRNLENMVLERTQELEKAQINLLQAAKLASIGELAAGVGHEINNPLAIIRGHLELLSKSVDKPNPRFTVKQMCEKMDTAVSRIASIVNSLRKFSRSDLVEKLEIFSVNSQLRETVELIQDIYKKESVEISLDFSPDNPRMKGGMGRFQQVIMNLISNAKDATEGLEKRHISCRVLQEKDEVCVQIEDNGCGIPPENLKRIFTTFFTTKERGRGTGLGLGISHAIILEMGGTLTVESAVGKGSTFTIRVPRSQAPVKTKNPQENQSSRQIQGKILLVEDEDDLRSLLKTYLKNLGLEVTEARDGLEALDCLKNESFEFVITDLKMPKMSGYELIEHIKKFENGRSEIVVMTGGSKPNKKELEIIEKNTNGILHKPFGQEELRKALVSGQSLQKIS